MRGRKGTDTYFLFLEFSEYGVIQHIVRSPLNRCFNEQLYNIKFPQVNTMQEQNVCFMENDLKSLLFLEHQAESIQHFSISNQEPFIHNCLPPFESQHFCFLDPSPFSPYAPLDHQPSLDASTNSMENDLSASNKKVPKKRKLKKRKKSLIDDNSPFHNCQKHLINTLKNIIIFPDEENEEEKEIQRLAKEVWKAFTACNIKTKRMLHSIFNADRENNLSQEELRVYGLLELYQKQGSRAYNAARSYLSKLAIDQLDNFNVQWYVNHTKIKDKKNFKEYVQFFRKELKEGTFTRKVALQNK